MRSSEARRALPAIPHVAVFDTAFHGRSPSGRDLCTPARVPRTRHPSVRLPRALGRSGRQSACRSTPRRLPPRRRLVGDRGARRPRRSTRPWASRRSKASRWRRVRARVDPGALLYLLRHGVSLDELDARSSTSRACPASPAPATSPALRARRPSRRASRSRSTATESRRRSPAMAERTRRARRARLHRRHRRARRAACAQRSSRDSASSVRSTCESSARERMSSPRAPRGASFRLRSIGR